MKPISFVLATALITAALADNSLNNPCTTAPFSTQPWCDAKLPIDARVKDMVSRMDLATEKIPTLNTAAPAIKSLGLNAYNWWEEVTPAS